MTTFRNIDWDAASRLSARRKADRVKMAEIVDAICRDAGATVTSVRNLDNLFPRRVALRITAGRGAYTKVTFDGDSCQPDMHICTWNLPSGSAERFSAWMPIVNPHHFQKATLVAHGLYDLACALEDEIADTFSGRAFDEARKMEYARKTAAGEHPWQRRAGRGCDLAGVGPSTTIVEVLA